MSLSSNRVSLEFFLRKRNVKEREKIRRAEGR
jgi:hypothetical protein